jgi:HEAT repeat protein
VTKTPHLGIIKDLRVFCLSRKKQVAANAANGGQPEPGETIAIKPLRNMTGAELAAAASSQRNTERLRRVVQELETRTGPEAIGALALLADAAADEGLRKDAGASLARNLARQPADVLRKALAHEQADVRVAVARAVGDRGLAFGGELIEVLHDADADVAQAARQALVKLAKGMDHGPERGVREADRAEAVRKWRAWWARQGGR